MVEKKIKSLIGPSLDKMGYKIFRVKLEDNKNNSLILQIMVENKNNNPINIRDCSKISKHVSVLLDVEELIKSSYNLEVSSPGINRPLIEEEDFLNFIGKLISIEFKEKQSGKRKIIAKILSVENNFVKIKEKNKRKEMFVSISQISDSYLIDEINEESNN